jgi:hypothetical protein
MTLSDSRRFRWQVAGLALAAPVVVVPAETIGFPAGLAGAAKWVAVAVQVPFALGLIPLGSRVVRPTDAQWGPEPAADWRCRPVTD